MHLPLRPGLTAPCSHFIFPVVPLQYVSEASQQYLETYRRYNYTTPKSYLELISLYKTLLARKRSELQAAKERLQNGVEKIAQASAQVSGCCSCCKPATCDGVPTMTPPL